MNHIGFVAGLAVGFWCDLFPVHATEYAG
jgi:hypothetical protein